MEGDFTHVVLVLVCVFPVLFLLTVAGPSAEGGTFGMAVVLLGVFWVGLGIAHAVCCASCPTAAGSSPRCLAGTFVGDTGRLLRRPGARTDADGPRDLAEQDRRGPGLRILTAVLTVWIVNLYQDWIDTARRSSSAPRVALAAPLGDLFESFIKRDAGTKDTGRCSAPTAGRWTGSTPCCSR
jgi:phosphatidate cytidylyltransferase